VSAPLTLPTPPTPPTPRFRTHSRGGGPGCPGNGVGASCLYLGPGAQPSVDVFSPEARWSPATDAAFVGVNASLQVTLCGKAVDECSPQHLSPDTTSVVVDSHLELVQLNAAGAACQTTKSPPQQSTIGNRSHHWMIYHKLSTVPVYPSCGPPQFVVKLLVDWVSGSTAKIDGPLATHAIGFTSYHGTAPPVPAVVGLNESAATSTLAASAYAPGILSYLPSTAAQGTVLSQDPAGGVIELPASVVNMALASAGVSVPKVLGLAEKTAQTTLEAAGLAYTVVSQQGCTDPGSVREQNPSFGAVVSPGTTVTLTVNSGTTKNGPCNAN
jgi:hypothetical protein